MFEIPPVKILKLIESLFGKKGEIYYKYKTKF